MLRPCRFEHGAWRKAALLFPLAICRTPWAVFLGGKKHAVLLEVVLGM